MTENPINGINFSSALSREIVQGRNFRVFGSSDKEEKASFKEFLADSIQPSKDSVFFDSIHNPDKLRNPVKQSSSQITGSISFVDDAENTSSKVLTGKSFPGSTELPVSAIKELVYNNNTPLDILVNLASDNKTTENKEISLFMARGKSIEVKYALATNRNTSSEVLQELVFNNDWQLRKIIAEHPCVSDKTLNVLAIDPSEIVRVSVAENFKAAASPAISRILANDKSALVKVKLAQNPDTSTEALKLLSADHNIFIRNILAESPFTETGILKALSNDKEWTVRKSVALNSSTPLEILKNLADDQNPLVRKAVFENPGSAKLIC